MTGRASGVALWSCFEGQEQVDALPVEERAGEDGGLLPAPADVPVDRDGDDRRGSCRAPPAPIAKTNSSTTGSDRGSASTANQGRDRASATSRVGQDRDLTPAWTAMRGRSIDDHESTRQPSPRRALFQSADGVVQVFEGGVDVQRGAEGPEGGPRRLPSFKQTLPQPGGGAEVVRVEPQHRLAVLHRRGRTRRA